MGYTHGKRCEVDDPIEIAFEDVLSAWPTFASPSFLDPMPLAPYIGQTVVVDNVRAWINGKGIDCIKWSGIGTIDMIQHEGMYIRIVNWPHYAWIERPFERVAAVPQL